VITDEIVRTTSVRVRYADTDKMGIVYNGNYLRFFEIGRTELLRQIGLPYVNLESAGYLLPVLEAHVEYRSPARYDDLLDIITRFRYTGGARIDISYEIEHERRSVAVGYTKHTFVTSDTFRPIKPPQQFIAAMERELQQRSIP